MSRVRCKAYFFCCVTTQKSSEVLIIIKTQRAHTQAVVQAIKDMHSYEVPEVGSTTVSFVEGLIIILCPRKYNKHIQNSIEGY